MTSRERVLKVLNHETPDRVPIDIGGIGATGMSVHAYIELKKKLGYAFDGAKVYDVFGMMAQLEDDLIEHFRIDTMMVPALCPRFDIPIDRFRPWKLRDGTPVQVPREFNVREDRDGSLLLMVGGRTVGKMPREGYYFSEIAYSTMGGIGSLREPPDPDIVDFPLFSEEDLRFRQSTARRLSESTDKALIVDLADNLRWNTSIANWLYAMALDPRRVDELHHKKSLNIIARLEQLAQAVGSYVQVFAVYQDSGTQKGELMSPQLFNELLVPHYKTVFSWIHRHTNWKILFHSCGSIYNLIPGMIEMGVDILNPVQCHAQGMEPQRLKREFGDKIVFWGGGVDTQTVLAFGTAQQVRRQVEERIRILGEGGGFVFAPTQDIQAEVPVDNIIAMLESALEYGGY